MRTRAKVLAAILCTVAALTTSGGTYVSASSEAADAKTEVTMGCQISLQHSVILRTGSDYPYL